MSPRLPPDPAEVSMRSERSAFAEAVPPGDVTMPCRGPVCVYAYYDDPWKTPVVMAPLRVTGQGEMAADGDVHTQSLTSFGMQDGDDGVPDVYPELGRQVIHDMPRVIVTAELVQDPSAAAEIERLEAEIIEALRGFAADMETALEPWLIEWNRTGWLGTVKVLFKGAKAGWDAWWEGEGELWASIWEWISSLPELAGDAWDSMTAGAKALWENKEKILQILQDMAEGAATAVKTGLEALLTLLENFPDLEEIIGKLRELVRYSAHWMNAMHELAQTQVLNVLASTMLAVLMATTPNFWAELVGKASGFLIPEVLLGILFGILAVFTGGTAGSGLMMRLMAFTRKVQQALTKAGAAGEAAAQIFDFLGSIKNKLIDLIQALLRNRTGKGTGEVGEEIPIVRKVRRVPPQRKPFHRQDLDEKWYDPETGELRWPPNDGFAGEPVEEVLDPGTRIDRYSGFTGVDDSGNYLSPQGTSFEARALPYDPARQQYAVYEVIEPLTVQSGPAAPWFDQVGGATQYMTDANVGELVESGALRMVDP